MRDRLTGEYLVRCHRRLLPVRPESLRRRLTLGGLPTTCQLIRGTASERLHRTTGATLSSVTSSAPSVVRGPAVATPQRRPGSVRRTSTIDMRWPGGRGTQLRLPAHARALWTPADGGVPQVLAEDVVHVGVAPDRTIEDIRSEPGRP